MAARTRFGPRGQGIVVPTCRFRNRRFFEWSGTAATERINLSLRLKILRRREESALMAVRRAQNAKLRKTPQLPFHEKRLFKVVSHASSTASAMTELRTLIQRHAHDLSEQLQAHQRNNFPPSAEKTIRNFSPAEAAKLVGIHEGYLRQVAADGRGVAATVTNGRRSYSAEDIQNLRRILDQGARGDRRYLPHRGTDEHLQIITVMNFKGGSGKTTTAAHLAQYLALHGYRVLWRSISIPKRVCPLFLALSRNLMWAPMTRSTAQFDMTNSAGQLARSLGALTSQICIWSRRIWS